jgi:hypothetical protein
VEPGIESELDELIWERVINDGWRFYFGI